jgi:hypothetical protein
MYVYISWISMYVDMSYVRKNMRMRISLKVDALDGELKPRRHLHHSSCMLGQRCSLSSDHTYPVLLRARRIMNNRCSLL